MARIFDVIEYPNEMKDEIVHRFPEEGNRRLSRWLTGYCARITGGCLLP